MANKITAPEMFDFKSQTSGRNGFVGLVDIGWRVIYTKKAKKSK